MWTYLHCRNMYLMYVGVLPWCWLQNMDIEELSNSVPVVVKVKLIVKIRHCEYP